MASHTSYNTIFTSELRPTNRTEAASAYLCRAAKSKRIVSRRAGEIHDHGGVTGGECRRATLPNAAARHFRGAGGVPGNGRRIRCDVLCSGPAFERDRAAHGAGREPGRCVATGARPSVDPGGDRDRDWFGGSFRGYPVAREHAVWSESD